MDPIWIPTVVVVVEVVVVVVGLFYLYLKHDYFYNDRSIEVKSNTIELTMHTSCFFV